MEGRKTIVVTGSNKGIGFALVESLAKESQWHVIMACRNPKLGQESLNKIKAASPNASIELAELDISNTSSIDSFIKKYTESNRKFDIFVNNAGTLEFEWSLESAQRNFQTNYYGTVYLTEKVLPLVNSKGKIITLSSMLAFYSFSITSEEIKNKWANDSITKADINTLVQEYITYVKEGTLAQKGYLENKTFFFYPATKLAVNVYLQRVFARLPEVISREIQVYNVHPGYIATDLNNNQGTGTLAQGIVSLNYLIHLPFEYNKDLQGKLFDKTQVIKLDTVIQLNV